jgi:alkylation response protein AidB-like acyl-CoA dehydrogenase
MKMQGAWGSGTTYVTFDEVKVPVENLIGKLNNGFKYIMFNFNHERLAGIIHAVRFSREMTRDALIHAHQREAFGKKLIDNQVIRYKLAHMARQIEATQAWLNELVWQIKTMPVEMQLLRLGGPTALLKAQATLTFEYCAREASQIFGGASYMRSGKGERVERLYRDVRVWAIGGGSEEVMLDLGIRQAIKVSQLMGAKL